MSVIENHLSTTGWQYTHPRLSYAMVALFVYVYFIPLIKKVFQAFETLPKCYQRPQWDDCSCLGNKALFRAISTLSNIVTYCHYLGLCLCSQKYCGLILRALLFQGLFVEWGNWRLPRFPSNLSHGSFKNMNNFSWMSWCSFKREAFWERPISLPIQPQV